MSQTSDARNGSRPPLWAENPSAHAWMGLLQCRVCGSLGHVARRPAREPRAAHDEIGPPGKGGQPDLPRNGLGVGIIRHPPLSGQRPVCSVGMERATFSTSGRTSAHGSMLRRPISTSARLPAPRAHIEPATGYRAQRFGPSATCDCQALVRGRAGRCGVGYNHSAADGASPPREALFSRSDPNR